ncbi:MAG: hypothetical protein JWP65_2549 [Ramlibacter sp.]|uniref:esterase/lipase family protein n=1 Tax=Ramlibacter sp. TaxID=1917967 RepID=UPI00260C7BF1|nr:hypothetical protein [Ramlibacter sp.]MDB5752128.1 hypothetical protein [Ramlibacter sp.]
MGRQTQLTGSPAWIEIAAGGYALRAPALRGTVREMEAQQNASRSCGGTLEAPLMEALARADVTAVKVFEIKPQAIDPAPADGTRAGGLSMQDGAPAMLLRVPPLGADVEHAVLYTDEAGVSRWIFPVEPPVRADAASGPEFLLPRNAAPVSPGRDPDTRGPLTKLGRRLVRVLAWATEDILGKGALAVATAWERGRRPYALRRFPLDDSRPIDWAALQGGLALLLVHGTFSSAAGAFALLPSDTVEALGRLYGGRMFAFDHPSLHHSPADNVTQLLAMLPPGTDLQVDVVTHSRGALVARQLIGHQPAAARLRVRRAVFVGAPHRGTVLADSDHGIDMLDRYTNLFTDLPDDAFTLGAEALFALAKLAYHGAVRGLPGLSSMHPEDSSLDRLNGIAVQAAAFHAIAADFKPVGSSLLARFGWKVADALVDGVFGEGNDGVVPTAGGYELRRAAAGFPIGDAQRLVYTQADGMHHLNFFADPRTGQSLLGWLAR